MNISASGNHLVKRYVNIINQYLVIILATRLHYIDWIRVMAFITLILFHCAVPFTQFNWEIKNNESSIFIDRIIIWLHQWRLPLLFFIAGVGVRFSLKKRSILKFVGERFVRLFLPLAFAIFFITPIQVYFERLQKKEIDMSYIDFYPTVFEFVPYPDGTITWSHMWFVTYLFVFTLLLLPVFSLAKIKILQFLNSPLETIFNYPIANLLLAVPFILYYFLFYIEWPEQGSLVDDWFVFNSSITFYLFGFLLSNIPSFWATCLKYRRWFLYISITVAAVLMWKYYWNVDLPKEQNTRLYLYGILNGLHIWTIILAVVGYTMRYLNYSNKYLTYLNTAVYPFYILHQMVIVAFGYYVLQWETNILLKLFVLIVICMASIWFLYHFIIRRTIVTRVLFGVKWNFGRRRNRGEL